MAERACEDARQGGVCPLFLVVFFVLFFVIIVFNQIAVFGSFALFFLVVLFVQIIGDEIYVHGVRLRNLEFGFTLGTTQDLAFFDFIFVHIDFGGTFWTTNHGVILRRVVRKVAVPGCPPPLRSVLYTVEYEVNSRARCPCRERHCRKIRRTSLMASSREYPEKPVVGIGGVIIDGGCALLIRRGNEPLRGEWSLPGGILELGETLEQGVARELLEETGMGVRVLELIEVFDRIYGEDGTIAAQAQKKPLFHYVIVDYLCQRIGGEPRAGSDVTDVAFAREDQLGNYQLTETATRILKKAFAMDRARRGRS
jgi:ADP-ribose pyrophosphatase YjhB (NUDIX family)